MALKRAGSTPGNNNVSVVDKSDNKLIHNWDEWFQSCGLILKDVQSYEDLMSRYYDMQYTKKPDGRQAAQAEYQTRHDSGFYNKLKKIPGWKMTQGILAFLIGFFVLFLFGFIFFAMRAGNPNISDIIHDKNIFIRGIIVGVVGGALICALFILAHLLRVNGVCKKMSLIESKIKDRIAYIPPKFRNSQSIDAFYDLYCKYNVVTLDQAIPSCETYLRDNNLIGMYMSIMFDIPYENASQQVVTAAGDDGRGLYAGGEKPDDPNLPKDIQSKTFQGVDDAEERLASLVGLKNVKQQIQQMKNRISFSGGAGSDRVSGNNMVFLGPPGTGKTTVARIITKILYDFGYIRENKCVEIEGTYLKSPYAGQTSERAEAIIRYAMGGVLFIDEAYSLLDDNTGAGAEAISVLLKAMEDYKNDFVVILAGYEDNINRLLASNEGFSSRIKHKLYFEDFTVDEMLVIFDNLMKSGQYRYKISKEARDLLTQQFEREKRVPGFGNARVVRNTWDRLLDVHADRFMKGELKEDMKFVITKRDMEIYIEDRREQMQADGRNFIASRNLDSSVVSLQELKGKTRPGSQDPDADLAKLTGLEVVKQEIRQLKAQFEFYDGKMENEGHHMLFLGPPGTGKTTVAAIMTGYLYKMGIIQTNSYLDINGDFLRGMYLGHTGKRTEAVVQYSQGMVLFVDEAYLLHSSDGSSDSFGQEAVGVLIDAMEKYRKNFVVIFAGYEYEMNKFLDMNSGLRSRISTEFHFQSYSPKELAEMLRNVGKSKGFKFEKDVWLPVQAFFRDQLTNPKFGNGRFVRQFFEDLKKTHIMNYSSGAYDESKKFVITVQDVENLIYGSSRPYSGQPGI